MPSITMKLLVFAVACVILVGTQTKTTQKRPTTREEMDKMVSRMMMRYPQNKSDLLVSGQKDGALEGPNLGYEPYWKNVYDIEWEDKCARCAKLFRRYTEVCAVDGTGEIVVNISMCGMMRQNCLKGFMRGHSVGNQKVDYALNTVVVADGWARLSIQQAKEASILLSSSVDRKPPYYQVMLDGFDGKKSQLYKNGESKPRTWYDNQHHGYWHQPLGTSEYEEFVIKWNSTSGDILITKSSYPNWWQGFYLMYTDPEPFNIRFISVSGYKNIKGNFTLKDFTVANVGPCGELAGGVPRPLPTSPTEVPPILGGYSVINWGYYTRLKEADVDKDKQYLSTREEY